MILQAWCIWPHIVEAQQARAVAETLFAHGQILSARGEMKAAKSAFKEALRADKNFTAAHAALGKIAMAEENWGEGTKQFQRMLKRGVEHPETHYYLGICHRESGRNEGIIWRDQNWKKSREHFSRVLAADSSFQDVLYQFALLHKYRGDYKQAIAMAQAQIRRRPDLIAPQVGLLRLYRSFLRHSNAEEAVNWLQQQPWEQAQLFIGEAFRRNGKIGLADSVFQELLERPLKMPPQPLFLALAKNYYQQFTPETAQQYYWRAVKACKTDLEAEYIFDELQYILSDDELEKYRALPSVDEKIAFFQEFWSQRDPQADTAYNARLAEHYRRLRYAEEHYVYDGFRTRFNDPDKLKDLRFSQSYALNEEFNDKGVVYLRHGPPDEKEVTPEKKENPATVAESWLYREKGNAPFLIFHFTLDELLGASNNWRFTPLVSTPQAFVARADWRPVFASLHTESDRLRRYALEIDLAEESADFVAAGLATDRHSDILHSFRRLLHTADSLFAAENYAAAREHYKKALKVYKDLTPAYLRLGEIAAIEENWREAKKQFQEVWARDRRNMKAHYYLGICYRELSAFDIFLLRRKGWEQAENHFKWVMARDSLYQDVIYQFALLQRDRGLYAEAIAWGHTQARLRPDLASAQAGLFKLYGHFIRHGEANEVLAWLQKQSGDHARYFIGELWRRQRNLQKADSVFNNLLARHSTMPSQPILLSLVKIHYAQKSVKKAEAYFWRAVDRIQNQTDADLIFEEIKYIATDEEWKNYRRRETPAERIAFFRQFWARRDPTPAAPLNARLAEHYRRLLHAEKNYEYDLWRSRLTPGDDVVLLRFPRTYLLNKEFNDLGLIYLRHGEPDEQATTVAAEQGNMSWRYYRRGDLPEMTFHFYRHPPEQNWRLTPTLDPELLADREDWGAEYFQLLREDNPGRQFSLRSRMGEESQASVETALTTDRHSWDKKIAPLDIPGYAATFRGENAETVLEVYYGLPIFEIMEKTPAGIAEIRIEKGLALHDMAWNAVDEQTREVVIPRGNRTLDKDELFLDVLRAAAAPDSYHVAIHARPQNADLLGDKHFEIKLPDYSAPRLALSDIILAFTIAPETKESKFVKNGLQIVPNPTRVFSTAKPVSVYFEIYHLQPDKNGETRFSVEYTLSRISAPKLLGIIGGDKKTSITVRADRQGDAAFAPELIALDVSNLEAGDYALMVSVRDEQSGATAMLVNQLRLK
jgi:tetratricopeptide (TPR) repeat protein